MEHEFHRWLKTQTVPSAVSAQVLIGIGDDAAMLSGSDDSIFIATDTIAEGTHFDLAQHSLELVGRKALAVNLSDLAAMAARPVATVLSFLLPKSFGLGEAQLLYKGIAKFADEYDVAIVGGDTNTWDGPLVLGATVIGKRDPEQNGWTIDGVKTGDSIVVSGCFGGSIHGRHLTFTPRVELALYLAEHYKINAATDVSDSLSLDLNALASASGVGVDFECGAIPISSDVQEEDPETALQHALCDGEDFELILSVPESEIGRLMTDPDVPIKLTVLGTATDEHLELRTMDDEGSWITVTPRGYVH